MAMTSMEVGEPMSDESRLVSKDAATSGGPATSRFVYVLTFLAAIGGFLFGYDTGVVSGAMVIIKDEFSLDTLWQELIVSVTIAAAAIFAAVGGLATDLLGRRPVITFASLVFTAGAICMGVANSKEILLAGRFIVGVAIGLTSMTVPMYIAESAPGHIRGTLVTINVLFITGGQFVASVIDGAFSYDRTDGWRYMLGLAGVPSLVQFVGFLCMPESPRWLVQHGKYDEAKSVLTRMRASSTAEEIEEEFNAITANIIDSEREMVEHSGGAGLCTVCVEMLSTPTLRRALVVGCGLQMFQQLAGINTVMYYSATIVEMSGVKDKSLAIWIASATAGVNFLCTFIGLYLIERLGRRPLALMSLTGVVISLLVLGAGFQLSAIHSPPTSLHPTLNSTSTCTSMMSCELCVSDSGCGYCYLDVSGVSSNGSCLPVNPGDHKQSVGGRCDAGTNNTITWAYDWCPSPYSWIPILGLVLYLFSFAPGMGPVPWTVNSEIYPHWARSYGNSAATFTNWIFNLLVSLTFLSLTQALSPYGAFYLYACLSLAGFLFVLFLLPETRGRSLEEVEGVFAQGWCGSGVVSHVRQLNSVPSSYSPLPATDEV